MGGRGEDWGGGFGSWLVRGWGGEGGGRVGVEYCWGVILSSS